MLAQLFLVFPISLNPLPWGLSQSPHVFVCYHRLLLFVCALVLEERFCLPSGFWEIFMAAPDVVCCRDAGLRQPLSVLLSHPA